MRIEDIVDDEYWMRQLLSCFNRQGLVKTPICMGRNGTAQEDELIEPATLGPVEQAFSDDAAGVRAPERTVSTFDDRKRVRSGSF
jgi:hypothetical protein